MLFDKRRRWAVVLLLPAATISMFGILKVAHAAELHTGGSPRIYIQPQEGFESYISAAIVKKHVPAVVTQNKDEAEYVLTSAVIAKEETTGSKIARCLFLYCAGADGSQTATVQLVNSRTHDVAWATTSRSSRPRRIRAPPKPSPNT